MRPLRSALTALALLGAAAPSLRGQSGQTFTAPMTDTYLQALYIDSFESHHANLLFEIFAWNGSVPTGPALWSSLMNDFTVDGLALYPGVLLDPGGVYGIFFTGQSNHNFHWWGYSFNNLTPLPGGAYYECTHDFGECSPYEAVPDIDIAGFRLEFAAPPTTAVPEPASLALLATGLAGLAGAARRKRRKEPA